MSTSVRLWIWITAALTAALIFNIDTASAYSGSAGGMPVRWEDECPPDIPYCWLVPQQSIQVAPASRTDDVETVSMPDPASDTHPAISTVAIPVGELLVGTEGGRAIQLGSGIGSAREPVDEEQVSCGVRALSAALALIDRAAPTYPALLEFLQDHGMMYAFGTGVEELAFAAQAFGYQGSLPFHGGTLDHLLEELEESRPVVVALGTSGEGNPGHFVLVNGVSADREWVTFFDPASGEQTIPWDDFEILWRSQGNSGIVVRGQAPGGEQGDSYLPWVALLAGLMALITQTPLLMFRRGLGGNLSFAFDSDTIAQLSSRTSSNRTNSRGSSLGSSSSSRSDSGGGSHSRSNRGRGSTGQGSISTPDALSVTELDEILQNQRRQTTAAQGGEDLNGSEVGDGIGANQSAGDPPAASRAGTSLSRRDVDIQTTLWNRLPLEDQLAIARTNPELQNLSPSNAATNEVRTSRGESAALGMPEWLARRACPPWIEPGLWDRLPPEDREHALLGFLNSWNGWVLEAGNDPDAARSSEEWEVHVQGGRVLQVTAPWLTIRENPGASSDRIGEIPQGWAVRWTGGVQEVDGRDWYEVLYNGERGWVSSRYVEEYVRPEGFPSTEPGHVWVPLPGLYSFSFYVVVDVDNYVPMVGDPLRFGQEYPLWIGGVGSISKVPFGALFSVSGVAMQGSGCVTLANGEGIYFSLSNPNEVMWMDATGEQVISTSNGFVNAQDGRSPAQGTVQVRNPDDAIFILGSRALELRSFSSVAGPGELQGSRLFVPNLAEHPLLDENGNMRTLTEAFPEFSGEFVVEDSGGAFPPGEQRFDLFIEEYTQGLAWYQAAGPERAGTEVYMLHEVGTRVP